MGAGQLGDDLHFYAGHAQGSVSADENALCSTFTGQPLSCSELLRAQAFNTRVMPSLMDESYRKIRAEMTKYGLFGSGWHVGHACPDPRKANTGDDEDYGYLSSNTLYGMRLVLCCHALRT